jgi:hypothetical protein
MKSFFIKLNSKEKLLTFKYGTLNEKIILIKSLRRLRITATFVKYLPNKFENLDLEIEINCENKPFVLKNKMNIETLVLTNNFFTKIYGSVNFDVLVKHFGIIKFTKKRNVNLYLNGKLYILNKNKV